MQTVLVTGATGFIASHLLPVLHQKGWQISAAVRNKFAQPPLIPIKTIKVGEIDGNTNWEEALEAYKLIEKDYAASDEGRTIQKFITRAEMNL